MESCYFLPSDHINNDLRYSEIAVNRLTASLIHSFLFEGTIILSDAVVVNTAMLRGSFLHPTIQEMVRHGQIIIAVREEDSTLVSLLETAKKLFANNSINPSFLSLEQYQDYSIIELIDKWAIKVPYSIQEAGSYYTDSIIQAYENGDFERYLPNQVKAVIIGLLKQKREEEGRILSTYAHKDFGIGEHLKERFKDDRIWDKYSDFIYDVSSANYHTFIPDQIGATPVYGKELLRAFEIWRRTVSQQAEPLIDVLHLSSDLKPSNFVNGLLYLRYEDVLALHHSEEFSNYKVAIADLQATAKHSDDVRRTYHEYRRRVDWKILERIGMMSKAEHKYKILIEKVKKIVGSAVPAADFVIMNILDRYYSNVPSIIRLIYDTSKVLKYRSPEIEADMKAQQRLDDLKTLLEGEREPMKQIIKVTTTVTRKTEDVFLNYHEM